MRIETEVPEIRVEIEDKEYAIAPRTVEVCEKLREAELEMAGKPAHRLWLKELEIILGKSACRELFSAGKDENVDRLQMIYYGVSRAFNLTDNRLKEEVQARRMEQAEALLRLTENVFRGANQLAARSGDGIRDIARPK